MMNIEKKLENIISNKKGNKELAIFCDQENEYAWEIHIGNPTNCVSIGEVSGEIVVKGNSLTEVIEKLEKLLADQC